MIHDELFANLNYSRSVARIVGEDGSNVVLDCGHREAKRFVVGDRVFCFTCYRGVNRGRTFHDLFPRDDARHGAAMPTIRNAHPRDGEDPMMRPLILGPAELASIEEVLTFAARPENHYRPFAGDTVPPGDKEGYIRNFGLPDRPYRCVCSLSVASNGELFRHLSISIPRMQEQSTAPNPFALWTLARAYGFTGWDGVSQHPPPDWAVDLPGFCVAIAQRYVDGA